MSRVNSDLAKDAPLLQGKKLFGEMPSVGGLNNKSQRLTDQIGLIKDTAHLEGYRAGFEAGTSAGQAEGRKAGFQKAMSEVQLGRSKEVVQFMKDLESFRAEFEEAVSEWFDRTEAIVTELSIEVVQQILATEKKNKGNTPISKKITANRMT